MHSIYTGAAIVAIAAVSFAAPLWALKMSGTRRFDEVIRRTTGYTMPADTRPVPSTLDRISWLLFGAGLPVAMILGAVFRLSALPRKYSHVGNVRSRA